MSIVINFLLVIHVIVCVLMVFVVLMQRPKSEGLGAAFGGGMTENLFGAQTTNVLQRFTRWLGAAFFGLTLLLSVLYAKQANMSSTSNIQRELMNMPKPVSTATPSAEVSPAASAKPSPSAASNTSPAPVSVTTDLKPATSALPSASPGLDLGTGVAAPSAAPGIGFPASEASPAASASPAKK